MYKLAAIDLDGTLLDRNGRVSRENREALLRFERSGGIVTLVSGRCAQNMRAIVDDLGLSSRYHIAMMGNQIFSKEKDYPVSYLFSPQQYQTIIAVLERFSVPYLVCADKSIYYKHFQGYYLYEWLTHAVGDRVFYREDMENIHGAYRLGVYCPHEKLYEDIYEAILLPGVRKYHSYPSIELIPAQANKAYALEQVAYLLGVQKSEILAVGDGAIDQELLAGAGLGVALANASTELKQVADVLLENTNEENGVALALYRYCIIQKEGKSYV